MSIGASGARQCSEGSQGGCCVGAIFGIAAALAVIVYRHKKLMGPGADETLDRLRQAAAINFMYGLLVRRIDNW